MIAIDRILCPVDLSDFSRRALAHAVTLARWYGSHVTVLHAFSTWLPPVATAEAAGDLPAPPQPDEVKEEVRRFCAPIVPAGLPLTIAVEAGDPVRTILRVARDAPPDLLVMGTHGRGGFERLLLGSVAEKVLRSVACPVLTVPSPGRHAPAAPATIKTILCPIDFGPSAERAFQYALSMAREADARLILLHVVDAFAETTYLADASHFAIPDYERYLERESLKELEALVPPDARGWCRPECRALAGKPYREILRVAEETAADLIVMGVQGRGAVDLLLFGSTTHHVIRAAGCAVLTLRAG